MLSERIPYYILDLLQLTPVVSVEGLGRFEAIFHSAKVDSARSVIEPPHIEGSFSANQEDANDTLEAFIRYTSGDQAGDPKKAIAEFVKSVLKQTKDGSPFLIDRFGTFVEADQGGLRFTPDWDAFNISFSGLESVEIKPSKKEIPAFVPLTPPSPYVPKYTPSQVTEEVQDDDNDEAAAASIAVVNQTKEAFERDLDKMDPSNSRLWWVMLTTAIILIAILCVYLIWDIMSNRERLNELRQAHADTTMTTPLIADSIVQADVPSDSLPDTDVPATNTNTPDEGITADEPPCYIVVGAFGDPENVTKMVDRLQSMSYTVEEIKGRTLTKVAIRTSCDQRKLQQLLDEVRSSVNPEAWIY